MGNRINVERIHWRGRSYRAAKRRIRELRDRDARRADRRAARQKLSESSAPEYVVIATMETTGATTAIAKTPEWCEVCESLDAEGMPVGKQIFSVRVGAWLMRLCLDCAMGAADALDLSSNDVVIEPRRRIPGH